MLSHWCLRLLTALSLVASSIVLVTCQGTATTPTGGSELSSSLGPTAPVIGTSGLGASASGGIHVFRDATAFRSVLRTSTIQRVSQSLSRSGEDVGAGTYELRLGGVRVRMNGPAFYSEVFGTDVLSKGVPVTIFFPRNAQGAGLAIAQLSTVKVTAVARNGDSLVLDSFSNGTMGFLGFTSEAGIASIEISDPDLGDQTTPITNLADITWGEVGVESLPMACAVLGDRSPSVRVEVQARQVTVKAVALGVGVPEEVNVSSLIVASVGRFRFWPDGRHQRPRVTSEVFPTLTAGNFPVEAELRYRYPDATPSGAVQASLDYELLSACFDALTGKLMVGALDEFGTCRPGEVVILQCDRGLNFVLP